MTTRPTPIPLDALLRHHHGAEDAGARLNTAAALAEDTAARETLAVWQAQDRALAALFPDPGAEIPAGMKRLLDEAPDPARTLPWRGIAAGIALFAAGTATGWLGRPPLTTGGIDPAQSNLAQTALAAHMTYVAEIAHPVEVPGTERDHLVRWLSKRLGQDIQAPDLGSQGFRLLGGRLLPGDRRPAALFMYEDDAGRRLTIYVVPDPGANTAFRYLEDQGQQGIWWTDDGLGCAIIGPLRREPLEAIAKTAYDQLL